MTAKKHQKITFISETINIQKDDFIQTEITDQQTGWQKSVSRTIPDGRDLKDQSSKAISANKRENYYILRGLFV